MSGIVPNTLPLSAVSAIGKNSTYTALGSSATFTGAWELNLYPEVFVMCKASNSGYLYFDFSPDGVNLDSTFPTWGFRVLAGVPEVHRAVKAPRYFRVRFINDTGAQTYMRLETYYGQFGLTSAPLNQSLTNDTDAIVAHTMSDNTDFNIGKYGIDRFIISKFGANTSIDTGTVPEDIWNGGGTYTGFPTSSAEVFEVFSSSVNDTSAGTGARTVRVFYLDSSYNMFDSSGNYLYFDVTLNGTTAVNSGVTGMRVWRAYILTAGSGTVNAGTITCRWVTTTSAIFFVMPIGYGQTEVACFTIPNGYTGYIKTYRASMADNAANQAQMVFWTRETGAAVRLQRPFTIATTYQNDINLYGALSFPEKTDLSMRCTSVLNNGASIQASFGILLIKNT